MDPRQLTAEHFASYPPLARRVATRGLDVLRRLPLSFVPLLLQEVIEYTTGGSPPSGRRWTRSSRTWVRYPASSSRR